MVRIHRLEHRFNLSDPAAEEELYRSVLMRKFAGIDPGEGPVPDETTICKFLYLLARHNLGQQIFPVLNRSLDEHGLKIMRWPNVDASVIRRESRLLSSH